MRWRGCSAAALAALLALAAASVSAMAAYPGRNGQIAFTTTIGDDLTESYVHAIGPGGGGLRRITGNGVTAAFSPDGRRIAYATPYGFGLRLKRADGRGRERVLTRGEDLEPDWSPRGGRVVFTRVYEAAERSELRIYRRGASRRLTAGSNPTWSVRGRIAFVRDGGIWVIRPDGSGLRRIVESGDQPDWSPNGRRLAFSSNGFVMTVRADGRRPRRLRRGSEPAFSPDGHQLAFIGPRGLTVMGVGGRHPRPVPNSHKPDFTGEQVDAQSGPDWGPKPSR
jgi:TolB protein